MSASSIDTDLIKFHQSGKKKKNSLFIKIARVKIRSSTKRQSSLITSCDHMSIKDDGKCQNNKILTRVSELLSENNEIEIAR